MPQDTEMTPIPGQPLSWRDVYRAVTESEVRIVASINAAVTPLNASVVDHESRIREIERLGCPQARQFAGKMDGIDAKVTALHLRVDTVEKDDVALMAREKGILATLSSAQKVIVLLGAILAAAYTMSNIIDKVAS